MKHYLPIKIALFGLFLNISIQLRAQDVEVVVKNVKSDKGILMVGLFNSEKTFTKEVFKGEKPKAVNGEVKVTFKNIPAGDYAVSVFHDENENGKLDTNLIGIPKEAFGFSNDAMGSFGPPSFEKAKIVVPAAKTVTITLKNM